MNKSEQSTDINLTGVGSFRIFHAQAPNNGRERQLLSTYMDTLNCLVVEIRMLRGFTTQIPKTNKIQVPSSFESSAEENCLILYFCNFGTFVYNIVCIP